MDTNDTVELPAPGSALRSFTRSREATAPGSETSQENSSDPCAANSPFPDSSIPSSGGWGFGHPGRLDAVSLDAF
ncbi:MAG: hypothetical protein JJU27_18300, partial [Gammaproteobacteria bacterium]|nr:hypothetical protein [Gammaproteobacteria bacterium]